MISEPGAWAVVAVLAAVLALDETALGQTWASLPAPAGLLTGVVLGRPEVGLAVGVLFQCVTIGNLPVGVTFTLDPVSAVVGVTAGAILAGWAPGTLLDGGAAAQWGWLLVACCLASLAGHFAIEGERRAHQVWMRTLRDGDVARVDRLQARCLAVTALRGAVAATLWAVLVGVVWVPAFAVLPAAGLRALGLVTVMAPALAVGTIVERFGPRATGPVVGSWALGWYAVVRFLL